MSSELTPEELAKMSKRLEEASNAPPSPEYQIGDKVGADWAVTKALKEQLQALKDARKSGRTDLLSYLMQTMNLSAFLQTISKNQTESIFFKNVTGETLDQRTVVHPDFVQGVYDAVIKRWDAIRPKESGEVSR